MGAIKRRHDMVVTALKSADLGQIKWRLAKFFDLYPGGADPDAIAAYADVLAVYPLFAIERACDGAIAAGATFRPSGPELGKLASAIIAPLYRELDALRAITTAEVLPAIKEDRHAVMGRMQEKYPQWFRKPLPPEKVRDIEAQYRDEKRIDWEAPMTLSDSARKAIGLMAPPSQREDEDIDF